MADDRWESSIDGIRGLGAAGIILFHCWAYLALDLQPSGLLARAWFVVPQCLTAFFVLSGFLLFLPYVGAALGRRPAPRVRTLWKRRFFRAYPAHTVIFLVACVLLPLGFLDVGESHGRLGAWGTVANLLLLQGYHPDLVLSGLGASWSMVPEVAFYLLLPAIGWAAVRLVGRFGVPALVAALVPFLAVGWVVRDLAYAAQEQGGGALGRWAPVLFYSFPAVVDLFAAGMLGAIVLSTAAPAWRRRIALLAIAVAGLAAVLMDLGIPGNTLVGLGFAGLYVLLCDPEPPGAGVRALRRGLGWVPLRFLGRISYASYLWHLPVVYVVATRVSADASTVPEAAGLAAIVFAATYLLAWVTTVAVVEPAIRYAHREKQGETPYRVLPGERTLAE